MSALDYLAISLQRRQPLNLHSTKDQKSIEQSQLNAKEEMPAIP